MSLFTMLQMVACLIGITYWWMYRRNHKPKAKAIHRSTTASSKTDKDQEDLIHSNQELKEIHNSIQERHNQAYQDLVDELESMRKLQRDVKAKLAGLQTLAQQLSEQKAKKNKVN